MARAAEKFFVTMQDDIDVGKYSKEHPLPEGEILRWKKEPLKPYFNPIRRKMGIDAPTT